MNKNLYLLCLLIIACFPLSGQQIVPTPDDMYADAGEFMYSGDYRDALEILLTLHARDYQTANINYLIGECYLNIQGQKTKAIRYLKEAIPNISANYSGKNLQEVFAPEKSLLYMGIACRLDYDFDNALHFFNKYILTIDDSDRQNVRSAEYHIERCNNARELMASPAKLSIDTLEINLSNHFFCFNPLVTADEKTIVFMDQLKFYDAVMTSQKNGTVWSAPLNLTPLIKSDGDHFVTGISSDGNKLLLTLYDPYQSGEIFSTEMKDGEWSTMQKLNSPVNSVFNESHASFSPDATVLYFTSDRKGGYGGTDIYKTVKNEKNEWGKPVNLGPLINSPYNEESPFVSSDGSNLFFSSQGHYNMGGFDIFCSSQDEKGNWLPPVNVGYPLNTTDDDLFFFPAGKGKTGYQSRFTGNSGNAGLIRFEISSFGHPARFIINGKMQLISEPGFNPESISVVFIERNELDTLAIKTLNIDGTFRQKLPSGLYKIDFNHNNKLLLSKDIEIPEYFPHNNLAFNDILSIPSEKISDTLYMKDILFRFNTSKPEEQYTDDIDKIAALLHQYPDITVKINGYADAIGGEQYNMKLSMNRANSIKEILESRMEKSLRVFTVAHGESNPVAINSNKDGSDNPEGRHYNRRVEIQFENLPDTLHVIHVIEIPQGLKLD
jgi:outer membrane protein OmpA-like peptidoglycan-associated protein